MKKITIFQEHTTPLVVNDRDNSEVEDYSKRISALLENNNISILHTSSCSVVLRPNKISSIVVSEYNTPAKEKKPTKTPESSPKKIDEHEDIIHD